MSKSMTKVIAVGCIYICACLLMSATDSSLVLLPPVPSEIANGYIDNYKDWAVMEMHRVGVPASVTLAQGMFESDFGRSRLAKKGNNHFGIKCKSDWSGGRMYLDDDKPMECFRTYATTFDSYKDHSQFLVENKRYKNLFNLAVTDYTGWAKGLKQAGYATDPRYAHKVIAVIERYNLQQYDYYAAPLYVDANDFCIDYDDKCVMYAPSGASNEPGPWLNIPYTGSTVKPNHSSSSLKDIDKPLAESIAKRPNVPRKCIDGRPVVAIDLEMETPKNNGKVVSKTSPKKILGRELNPNFDPSRCVMTTPNDAWTSTSAPHPNTHSGARNYKAYTTNNSTSTNPPNPTTTTKRKANANTNTTANAGGSFIPYTGKKQQDKPAVGTKDKTKAKSKSKGGNQMLSENYKPSLSGVNGNKENAALKEGKMLPKRTTNYKNGSKIVKYPYEVSPTQIAHTYHISEDKLMDYNNLLKGEVFTANTNVFLEAKKVRYSGKDRFHIVKKEETMWDISQQYGIDLDDLYKRNKLIPGTQPRNETRIMLKGKANRTPKVRYGENHPAKNKVRYETNTSNDGFGAIYTDPASTNNSFNNLELLNSKEEETDKHNKEKKDEPQLFYHTVRPLETVAKIAKLYGISKQQLRINNKLKNDDIKVGQTLMILKR